MTFNIRAADLRALNSMTKYPSIPTYHSIDPKNGVLQEGQHEVDFTDLMVIGTEKVDGASARMIFLPDGSWLIGSREELLTARNDIVANPMLGIVDTLLEPMKHIANRLSVNDTIGVFYVEVFGHKKLPAWKQYGDGQLDFRLFDAAEYPDFERILSLPIEQIASWREHGGQEFLNENELQVAAELNNLRLTPRLFEIDAADLPTEIAPVRGFLEEHCALTRVGRNPTGRPEGIVLRAPGREVIAKARFKDYDRTLSVLTGQPRR
jgi:hypothetical protein